MKTVLALAIIAGGIGAPVLAQEPTGDTLFITGQVDAERSLAGAGADIEWLHPLSPRTQLIVGSGSVSVDDVAWAYGTIGATDRSRHFIWSAVTSAGLARVGSDRSLYAKTAINLTVPVVSRVYIEGEGQHARIHGSGTTVLGIGSAFAARQPLTLRAMYRISRSAGATLLHSVSGRVDFQRRWWSLVGGTSSTWSEESTQAPAVELLTHASREYFGGLSVDTRAGRLLWSAHVIPRGGAPFTRVTTTWQMPLSRRTATVGSSQ